ncbi:protein lin-32-like [Panonychus citri]|uniref:protein lin-32-like n=1 Tax=Panonychus citri TaxID=50023 RepID=UPI0023080BE7|nr:protein lin-32-like [Panonychus citri]
MMEVDNNESTCWFSIDDDECSSNSAKISSTLSTLSSLINAATSTATSSSSLSSSSSSSSSPSPTTTTINMKGENEKLSCYMMKKCQHKQVPVTTMKKRRQAANARERKRMKSLNVAFNELRSVIPPTGDRKLSKFEILQMAQKYINILCDLLRD